MTHDIAELERELRETASLMDQHSSEEYCPSSGLLERAANELSTLRIKLEAAEEKAKRLESDLRASESLFRNALALADKQHSEALAAANAQVEKLTGALEPFAKQEYPWQEPDHWPAFGNKAGEGWPTVGDLRRARAALSPRVHQGPGSWQSALSQPEKEGGRE